MTLFRKMIRKEGGMRNTELYWNRQWNELSYEEARRFLIQENAYFIYERRMREGKPGTPEEDWAAAEKFVSGFIGFPLRWPHLLRPCV